LHDPERAATALAEPDGIQLDPPDREQLADTLAAIAELHRDFRSSNSSPETTWVRLSGDTPDVH
jgi:hypothetical protein